MATYYVSPSGSDSNTGTSQAAPWRTFAKAAATCVAGDTAIFLDGRYTTGTVTLNTSGTSTSPIIFRAQNKWGAIVSSTSSCQPALSVTCSYNVIRGFKFEVDATNVTCGAYTSANCDIRCWEGATPHQPSEGGPEDTTYHHTTIEQCWFATGNSIRDEGVKSNADYTIVQDNLFDNSLEFYNNKYSIARRNEFRGVDWYSIAFFCKGGGRSWQVYDNYFHINVDQAQIYIGGAAGSPYQYDNTNGPESYYTLFYNNIIVNENAGTLYFWLNGADNARVFNNVFVGVTVIAATSGATNAPTVSPHFINNIFYGRGGTWAPTWNATGTPVLDHNCIYNYSGGLQTQTNLITTDPQFVNVASDWDLQPTSPCLNTGTTVSYTGYYSETSNPLNVGTTYAQQLATDYSGQARTTVWSMGVYDDGGSTIPGGGGGTVRYIRDTLTGGSNVNSASYWVEIKAFEVGTGTNVALAKTVTGNFTPSAGAFSEVTDDDTDGDLSHVAAATGGYVTVDLGAAYDLATITVWHYWGDARTFNTHKLEVSENGIDWTTIWDSTVNGTYVETNLGKTHNVPGSTSTAVGSFTTPAVTGSVAYTGLGFQPKAILIWGGELATVSTNNEVRSMFGAATSSTARWVMIRSDNSGASLNSNRTLTTKLVQLNSAADVAVLVADLVSFDADGFTLNYTTAKAVTLSYWAIGGLAVSAKAGTLDTPFSAGTGTQSYAGLGFQPRALITAMGAFNNTGGNGDHCNYTVGFATGASAQVANCSLVDEGPPSDTQRLQVTNSTIMSLSTSAAININATLQSFNPDGFSLNWTAVGPAATRVGYLALGGNTGYKAVSFTEPATASISSVTGVGFTPKSVLVSGVGRPTSGTVDTTNHAWMFGAEGTLGTRAVWNNRNVGGSATASQPIANYSTVQVITSAGTVVGTGSTTSLSSAQVESYDLDGFSLDWGWVSGTSLQYIGLAVGEAPAGVGVEVVVVGVAATSGLGSTTQTGKASTTLTGVAATAGIGTATAAGTIGSISVNTSATGVSATLSLGTTTQTGKASTTLTGVAATGAVGEIVYAPVLLVSFTSPDAMRMAALPTSWAVTLARFYILPDLTAPDSDVSPTDPSLSSPWTGI